ncbi:MAG: RNA-dependent RNA polymerase [Jingmen bat rhabdovirus 1]|nr:MAG: RNA-dependent RNA polymerase [Jingmen bat rhabdovirus 1]WPV62732.1 MAG: RNA-dependent RNA polymerase [Jingmen bat rhabdovirus 1]
MEYYENQDLFTEGLEELLETTTKKEASFQFPNYHLSLALTYKNKELANDPQIPIGELPPGAQDIRKMTMEHLNSEYQEVDLLSLFHWFLLSALGSLVWSYDEECYLLSFVNAYPPRIGQIIGIWIDSLIQTQIGENRYEDLMEATFSKFTKCLQEKPIKDLFLFAEKLKAIVLCRNWIMMHGKRVQTIHPSLKSLLEELRIKLAAITDHQTGKLTYHIETRLLIDENRNLVMSATTEAVCLRMIDKNNQIKYFGVGDFDMILSWSDLCQSRLMCLFTITGMSGWNLNSLPSLSTCWEIFKWGDIVLKEKGNEGFRIVKHYESVLISTAQIKINNELNLGTLNDAPLAIISDFNDSSAYLSAHLHQILDPLTPHQLLECMSFFRLWGHPIIQEKEGLEKLHKNCTIVKHIDHDFVSTLASDLARIMLTQYYWHNSNNDSHSWPEECHIDRIECPLLYHHIINGTFPSTAEIFKIGPVWHKVTYKTLFSEGPEIPLLDLLGDKSHSINLDEMKTLLYSRKNKYMLSSTRRLLISILKTKKIDPVKYLNHINIHGFAKEDFIIGLKAKEREVKIEGRFFSLMSFALRLYIVSTEYIAAKYILPLFPEITMGMSGTDTMRMMCELTKGMSDDSDTFNLLIHLDYEKWNNHQRHEANELIFQQVDKAFGWTKVISQTHQIFKNSFIYFVDRLDKIDPGFNTQLPYCWSGQSGGLEGLRQKMWTVVGALMLRRVGLRHNQDFDLMMQGDNQIVIAKYHLYSDPGTPDRLLEKQQLASKGKSILRTISEYSDKLGLITKLEETWISSSILIYGKYPIVRGESAGMFLKLISRLFSTSNDATPSLTNVLSSAVTVGLTAAQRFKCVTAPMITTYWYMCNIIWQYMRYNPVLQRGMIEVVNQVTGSKRAAFKSWNPCTNPTHQLFLLDLLFRDSILGGSGGTTPLRFFIREFPDPLTESLSAYRSLLLSNRCTKPEILRFLSMIRPKLKVGAKDYKRLIESPTSLALTTSPHTKDVVKHHVSEYLEKHGSEWIANVDLSACLVNNLTGQEEFVKKLMTIQPCVPNFISTLYSNTAYGVLEGLLNRISGPSTITSLFATSVGQPFWKIVGDAEMKCLYNAINRTFNLDHIEIVDQLPCSTTLAQDLREWSWGIPLYGVTVPHPSEQVEIVPVKNGICLWCDTNAFPYSEYISVIVDPKVVEDPSLIFTRGEGTPYLGSATVEKRSVQSECEATTDQPGLRQLLNLINTINWFVDPNSSLSKLISLITTAKTDYPLIDLIGLRTTSSGCVLHRFFSDRSKRGGFTACSFNPATHIVISGDTLNRLNRDSENYIILFQAIFLYAQQVITEKCNLNHQICPAYHLHFRCPKCLLPAEDINLTAPPDVDWGVPSMKFVPNSIPGSIYPPTLGETEMYTSAGFIPAENVKIFISNRVEIMENEFATRIQPFATNSAIFWTCLIIALDGFRTRTLLNADYKPFFTTILNKVTLEELIQNCSVSVLLETIAQYQLRQKPISSFSDLRSKAIQKWSRARMSLTCLSSINHSTIGEQLIFEDISSTFSFLLKSKELQLSFWSIILARLSCISSAELNLYLDERPVIVVPTDLNSTGLAKQLISSFRHLTSLIPIGSLCNKVPELRYTSLDLKSMASEMLPIPTPTLISKGIYQRNIKTKSQVVWAYPEGFFCSTSNTGLYLRSPIIHFVRLLPELTTAWYKIADLVSLPPSTCDVMVLGDGNGGFSAYLVRKYPHVRVFFNSLIDISTTGSETLSPKTAPSFLRLTEEERKRVVNWSECTSLVSDMSSPHWLESISELMTKKNFNPQLIISDIEMYETSKYVSYLKNIVNIACSSDYRPDLLLKTHWPTSDWISSKGYLSVRTLAQIGVVRILRSRFSNIGSGEIYVECSRRLNYVPPSITDITINMGIIPSLFFPDFTKTYNLIKKFQKSELIGKNPDMSRNNGILTRIVHKLQLSTKIPELVCEGLSISGYSELAHYALEKWLNSRTVGKDWNLDTAFILSLDEICEVLSWYISLFLVRAFLQKREDLYLQALEILNGDIVVQLVKVKMDAHVRLSLLFYHMNTLPKSVKGFSLFKKIPMKRCRVKIQEHIRYMGGRFWTLDARDWDQRVATFSSMMDFSNDTSKIPAFECRMSVSYEERLKNQFKRIFNIS